MKLPDLKQHMKKQEKGNVENDDLNLWNLIGIKGIRDGIVVLESGYISFLEIMPVNFELKSENEQNYIIDRYEELLKVIKAPFYVFTIAKKADPKEHIEKMEMQLATEANENVKSMIHEYTSYVGEISYRNAVQRRFIVAIPYISQAGTKITDLKFQIVSNYLHQKVSEFKTAVSKCGNEVVATENPDQFAAEILFELLNVKISEKERIMAV